jgi:CRISPR/Cas system-associated protein Cas10 (large subunit of type III CRISPR-Cas system)
MSIEKARDVIGRFEALPDPRNATCVWCGSHITGFRDDISRREYIISHLCQKCQDGVFDK